MLKRCGKMQEEKWYTFHTSEARKMVTRELIMRAIPLEPDEVKMKDLIGNIRKERPTIGMKTIYNHIDEGVERGTIQRYRKRGKRENAGVYVRRTECSKVELLILQALNLLREILRQPELWGRYNLASPGVHAIMLPDGRPGLSFSVLDRIAKDYLKRRGKRFGQN